MPTLQDVARAAGVSAATASRALNRADTVSASLVERVELAAQRLGYVPNSAGQALSLRRSRLAGIIVPSIADPEWAVILAAVHRRFDDAGYGVLAAASDGRPEQQTACARALMSHGVEALVLARVAPDGALRKLLAAQAVPWVSVEAAGSGEPSVDSDHRGAVATAARYLLGVGHRRFGILAGKAGGDDRAAERAAGIVDALTAAHLAPESMSIVECKDDFDAGRAAMAELLAAERRPTAVLCGSDLLAAAALQEATAGGVSVPEALSIVGFGDTDVSRLAAPPLTTIRVASWALGVGAAGSLLARLNGETPPQRIQVPGKLVLRGSTGPAPSG